MNRRRREGGYGLQAAGYGLQTADGQPGQAARRISRDVFIAVTKTMAAGESVAVVGNGGLKILKMSNGSLAGLAGNAPEWKPLGFASGGVILNDVVTVGAEVTQQPEEIDGFSGAEVPATISFFGRIAPAGGHFAIDVAVVRLAGSIGPGLDVKASHQLVVGASVGF